MDKCTIYLQYLRVLCVKNIKLLSKKHACMTHTHIYIYMGFKIELTSQITVEKLSRVFICSYNHLQLFTTTRHWPFKCFFYAADWRQTSIIPCRKHYLQSGQTFSISSLTCRCLKHKKTQSFI